MYTLYTLKIFIRFPTRTCSVFGNSNGGQSDLAPFFLPQKQDHF